jgi:hypothetical protein
MPTEEHQPCLVVGTPCYGRQVTDLYAGSLLKLQMACWQRGISLQVQMKGSDALITRARQNIVADFLANESASHLLFIDADIGFEPEQVFRLMDCGADVCAAIYPIKRIDWQKVTACAAAQRTPIEAAALTYLLEFVGGEQIQVNNGFAKVSYAGTGFLMVRRHVLLAMIERYPELRYRHDHKPDDKSAGSPWRCALFNCLIDEASGVYLSEDFSFCKRWTDMGGEIWADLQSRFTHVGTVSFRGDLRTQFKEP